MSKKLILQCKGVIVCNECNIVGIRECLDRIGELESYIWSLNFQTRRIKEFLNNCLDYQKYAKLDFNPKTPGHYLLCVGKNKNDDYLYEIVWVSCHTNGAPRKMHVSYEGTKNELLSNCVIKNNVGSGFERIAEGIGCCVEI